MATEKILNTRIQLKYDTWSNWQAIKDTFFPKRGEICLVELPSTPDGETIPTNPPTVLFKVGTWDGGENATKKSFASLDWASAKAADVYSWAKASEVKLVGKKLTFVGGAANGGNVEVAFDYVTLNEVNGLLANYYTKAEINTTLANYSTTEQMNAAIDADVLVETNRAIAAENALANRVKDIEDNKADYATKTEAQGYATTAQGLAEQKAAELVNAHTEAVNTKFNSYSTTEQMNAAIDADVLVETNRATGAEEALAGRIKTLEDTSHDFAGADAILKAELQSEIDADVKALADGAVKANTEAIAAINDTTNGILATAKAYTDTLANGAVATNTSAIAAINDAEDGILATAKAYTDEVKDALLGTEELVGTYDTLKEIGAWIANSGVDATELSGAIAAEAKAREDADKLLATKAELAAETKAREDADAVINGTIATLETKADATEKLNTAKKYTDDSITALDLGTMSKEAATDYVKKSEATGYDDILTATVAASTYRTEAQVNSQIDSKITTYNNSKNFGDIITHSVAEFATAAQGAQAHTHTNKALLDTYTQTEANLADAVSKKHNHDNKTVLDGITSTKVATWDAALQEIKTTDGGGLKVTNKNQIDFDPEVIFVFDCGNASKNI